MNTIQVSHVVIRQNENGLFSLNDLHKASGGANKHKPAFFLRNEETQNLISEINRVANSQLALEIKRGGENQGTYVCKELVIAYGMWINASFALKVIQCFLSTQSTTLTPTQKQQIREAVKARHYRTGEHWQTIYEKLHNFCKVNSYHEIQAKDFQAALDFLGSIPNAPEVVKQKELSPEIIRSIAYLLLHAQNMKLFVNRYLPAFENLGIDNRGALYSYIHDTIHVFDKVRDFVLPQLPISNEHSSKWGNTDYLRAKIVQTANV